MTCGNVPYPRRALDEPPASPITPASWLTDGAPTCAPFTSYSRHDSDAVAPLLANGVAAANLLFGQPMFAFASTERAGMALAGSEAVATFGLLVVIFGVVRSGRLVAVPAAVGAWIAGAIYFTSSASFANPAVTVSRMLTDTYTGIAPATVVPFVLAQLVGAAAAAGVIGWLFRAGPQIARQVVVPHEADAS